MALTLQEQYAVRFDRSGGELERRVVAAVGKQASSIVTTEDPATANHANRLAWAKGVLRSGTALQAAGETFMSHIAFNGTIAASLAAGEQPPDADIEYVVNVSVDHVVGVAE